MTIAERRQRAAERKASAARIAAAQATAREALTNNRCPCCGQGVKVNLALTGWVQCVGYADPSMRGQEHKEWERQSGQAIVRCGWQGFTR